MQPAATEPCISPLIDSKAGIPPRPDQHINRGVYDPLLDQFWHASNYDPIKYEVFQRDLVGLMEAKQKEIHQEEQRSDELREVSPTADNGKAKPNVESNLIVPLVLSHSTSNYHPDLPPEEPRWYQRDQRNGRRGVSQTNDGCCLLCFQCMQVVVLVGAIPTCCWCGTFRCNDAGTLGCCGLDFS